VFRSDDLIGSVTIDLFSLATGPSQHHLNLYNGSKQTHGMIKFEFHMRHLTDISLSFNDVKVEQISSQDHEGCKFLVKCHGVSNIIKIEDVETDAVKEDAPNSRSCTFPGFTEKLRWDQVDLPAIMCCSADFTLFRKRKMKNENLGHCSVPFSAVIMRRHNANLEFFGDFKSPQGLVVGRLKMRIAFHDLPKFCQFGGGERTDGGCTGVPILPDMPLPEDFLNQGAAQQQPAQQQQPKPQQPAPQQYGLGGQNTAQAFLQPNKPSMQIRAGDITYKNPFGDVPKVPSPVQATKGTAGIPVGWERAVDSQGKVYYIDHNTRTTHWSLPKQGAQQGGQVNNRFTQYLNVQQPQGRQRSNSFDAPQMQNKFMQYSNQNPQQQQQRPVGGSGYGNKFAQFSQKQPPQQQRPVGGGGGYMAKYNQFSNQQPRQGQQPSVSGGGYANKFMQYGKKPQQQNYNNQAMLAQQRLMGGNTQQMNYMQQQQRQQQQQQQPQQQNQFTQFAQAQRRQELPQQQPQNKFMNFYQGQ